MCTYYLLGKSTSILLRLHILYMQVKHKEIVRQLKQQLGDSLATVDAQEQRIQMLQDDSWKKSSWGQPASPTKKSSSLKSPRERKVKSPVREGSGRSRSLARSDEFSTSRSPSPSSLGSGKAPPGGRWTAHRADIRKVSHFTHYMYIS